MGGGQLLGSGRMWVSPKGEMDPRAVKVHLEGRKLPTESLLKRYLPKVGASSPVNQWPCYKTLTILPPAIILIHGSVTHNFVP